MTHRSDPFLLVLHAVRVMGYADTSRIATRVTMPEEVAHEHLLDAQAHGWSTWSSFGDDGGWSPTERGKTHGEQLLAAELDFVGGRRGVADAYEDFLAVNDMVARACTQWQVYEMGIDAGPVSLEATLHSLSQSADALQAIETRLTDHLARFDGYHARFTHALRQALDDPRWVTGTDRDSAHRVWFELHEDLIVTLGLRR